LRNHELVACVARTQHAGLEVLMRLHLHLPSYATAALLALVTCRGDQGPEAPRQVTAGPRPSLATVANGITLVGAGNIARCDRTNDEATATLLDAIPGTVFALGDAAYPNGTTTNYTCYNASWGRHKARTYPATGNHDYDSSATASAYFQYFGTVAGDTTKGYYSYDLGSWHIIVLSSDRQPRLRLERHRLRLLSVLRHRRGRHDQGLLQLRPRFLAHHRPQQQLQPRRHGGGLAPGDLAQGGPRRRRAAVRAGDVAPFTPSASVKPFWDDLYAAHATLIVNAHMRDYERFAPQTPAGTVDSVGGIRQFIIGTGGEGLDSPNTLIAPNSEVRISGVYGVLKLTLGDVSYSWQFVPVGGQTATDAGSGTCYTPVPIVNAGFDLAPHPGDTVNIPGPLAP